MSAIVTKIEAEAVKFYRDTKFLVAIAIPYLGLIIDMIHNELIHVSDYSQPYTVLLTKAVFGLTAVYTAAKAYENGQIYQAPAPVAAQLEAPSKLGSTAE